jgi:hypothetical protein
MHGKKILGSIAAAGFLTAFGLTGSADASQSIHASTTSPIVWGCVNPATNGLVGGRFYEYDGTNTYPGCNAWANKVYWGEGVDALQESVRTSVKGLAIDGAPGASGNGGSGGWGWDSTNNVPVTSVAVGDNAPLTVTAMQANPQVNGTITLSWNPDDFSLVSNGDGSATQSSLGAGEASFDYTDFAHTDKGDTFVFKALSSNSDAVVSATVTTADGQATATFPIAIQ